MSNSDDPKFDDYQNPNEEQDLNSLLEEQIEDVENVVDDESIDLDSSFEESVVDLEFPDESLLGENTATYADELDMFADLNGDLTFTTDVATDAKVVDEMPIDTEETAENSFISAETDDLFADVDSVTEPEELMGHMDAPILAAAIEDIPTVEDKKAKKAREKAEKAQVIAQAKAAKMQAKAEKAQAKVKKGQAKTQVKIDDPTLVAAIEDAPVVEDKKAKKAREKAEKAQAIAQAKAEKAQAKAGKIPEDKPPKAKKEKKPKMPGNKQPGNVGTLCFTASLVLMLSAFGGVNAYAIMKHGVGGAMVFLAIFDLLAAGALVIPFLLRRSKNTITESDVSLGIAAISLIVGCMFVLANLAINLLKL